MRIVQRESRSGSPKITIPEDRLNHRDGMIERDDRYRPSQRFSALEDKGFGLIKPIETHRKKTYQCKELEGF